MICNYSRQLANKYSPMTQEDELQAFVDYKNTGNQESYHRIFESTYNLVLKCAHKYKNQGVPVEDLIQEGALVLGRAIKEFDHTRGLRFITYAIYWIRQGMLDLMAHQSRDFSVNNVEARKKHTVIKATNKLAQKLCRMPSFEEISEETGIPLESLNHMDILEPNPSMDAENADEKKMKLRDTIRDNNAVSPDDMVTVVREKIYKLLDMSNLSDMAKDVIKRYYGIGYDTSFGIKEIGDVYKLTHQRIAQIKEETLNHIRKINELQKKFSKFHIEEDMLVA